MHEFFSGNDVTWFRAVRQLYAMGVRYVIYNKTISLEPSTMDAFTGTVNSFLHGRQGRTFGSRYSYRCRRVGDLIADTEDYSVYRLNHVKLTESYSDYQRSLGK